MGFKLTKNDMTILVDTPYEVGVVLQLFFGIPISPEVMSRLQHVRAQHD